jgi:hypothetical protein
MEVSVRNGIMTLEGMVSTLSQKETTETWVRRFGATRYQERDLH